jgi:hypothetical protein
MLGILTGNVVLVAIASFRCSRQQQPGISNSMWGGDMTVIAAAAAVGSATRPATRKRYC